MQNSVNTINVNIFGVKKNAHNVFCHPSRTLVKLSLKLGSRHRFVIWTCGHYCPVSSQVWLLVQKLFWAYDKGFKIASCVALHTWYPRYIQIWTVIWWPLFLFNHLWTVLIGGIVERHLQCAQSSIHLVESAAPSDSSRLHSSVKTVILLK